jgi:hypothetical protein
LTRAEYDRSYTTIHNAWATYRHNLHRWDIQQQEEKLPRQSPKYLAAIRAQKHQQPREEQLLREAQRLKREERVRKEQRMRANREAEAQGKIVKEQQRKLRETMQRKVEEEQRQREEHELKVRQQMEEVERRRAADQRFDILRRRWMEAEEAAQEQRKRTAAAEELRQRHHEETERREKEREELEVKKQAKCFQTDQTADSANNGLGVSATDESESSMRDRRQVSHDDNEGQQRAMDNEHAISTPMTQRPPESIRNETAQEPRVRRSKRSTSASRRRLRFHLACQHAQRGYCKFLQTLGGLGHEDELKGMSINLGWQDEEADGECDDCGDFIDSEMWVCPEGGARMCEECYMKLSWYDGSRLVYVLVQRAQEA